jgi:hypothetical protein
LARAVVGVIVSVALIHLVALIMLFPVSDTACYALPLSGGVGPYNFISQEPLRIYSDPGMTCTFRVPGEDRTVTLTQTLVEERNKLYVVTGLGFVASVIAAVWSPRRATKACHRE